MIKKDKIESKNILFGKIPNIILFPLFLWFLLSFINILKDPYGNLPILFFPPINAVLGIIFSIFFVYHMTFEINNLINSFVLSRKNRKNIKLFVNCLSTLTIITTVLAILQLHLTGIIRI